jgi:hypothetical protein
LVAGGQQYQADRDLFLRFVGAIVAGMGDIPTLQVEPPKGVRSSSSPWASGTPCGTGFDRSGDRFESRVELSSREDTSGDGAPLCRHVVLEGLSTVMPGPSHGRG